MEAYIIWSNFINIECNYQDGDCNCIDLFVPKMDYFFLYSCLLVIRSEHD